MWSIQMFEMGGEGGWNYFGEYNTLYGENSLLEFLLV